MLLIKDLYLEAQLNLVSFTVSYILKCYNRYDVNVYHRTSAASECNPDYFGCVLFFLALASVGYEKTCVLFNIGALSSQIASEQNLDNDEGLKTAAKFYQVRVSVYTQASRPGIIHFLNNSSEY